MRLLVVSESGYSWYNEPSGHLTHPGEDHPAKIVEYAINEFDALRDGFLRRMTMALAGKSNPDASERQAAYTIYIQGTVGDAPRIRPIKEMYDKAKEPFLDVLNNLQPRRIVIVGLDAWAGMPDARVFITRDFQAYRLNSGKLAWCIALGHTAGSQWPGWSMAHDAIEIFCSLNLPDRVPSEHPVNG
jgi:hypothetical protein